MPHQESIIFDSTPVILDKFFLKLKTRFEALSFDCVEGAVTTNVNLFDTDTIFLAVKEFNNNSNGNYQNQNKPIAKAQGLDYRDLRPSGDWKSTAFLYEHSPREYTRQQSYAKLDLSFVISYQQKLLIPDLGYQMSEKLQLICANEIKNLQGKSVNVYTNRETVFTDFNIDYSTTIFTDEINHFRIRFSVEVPIECIPFQTNVIFNK